MSFNWEEYLTLAETLSNNPQESYLRSAISRAYYSVFCIARNRTGFKNHRESNVHFVVINKLKSHPDTRIKKIGKNIDELRRYRNEADYNEDRQIDKELTNRAIILAQNAFQLISRLR